MKKIWLLIGFLAWGLTLLGQDSTYQIRVMQYNLMAFGLSPGNGCTFDVARYSSLGTVLDHYRPHLLAVNEIAPSELYRQNIITQSMKYPNSMEAAPLVMERQSDRTSLLYYDSSLFGYLGTLPCPNDDCVLSSDGVRDILVYELFFKPSVANGGDTTFLTLIVAHFKASDGAGNENQRNQSAQQIMSWINNNASDKNVMLLGDLNIGYAGEAAFQTLINNSNAALSFRDPINKTTGWTGAGNAAIHTQSTRSSGSGCFVGGGLDDRFDFILTSDEVLDGSIGAQFQAGSYKALGNDGSFYNQSIGCASGIPNAVCTALYNTSDHLPLTMTLDMVGAGTSNILSWSQELKIGPQPMREQLRVEVTSAAGQSGWEIEIFDLMGRLMYHQEGAPQWVTDVENWPSGVYQLRVSDPLGRSFQRKLLKVSP